MQNTPVNPNLGTLNTWESQTPKTKNDPKCSRGRCAKISKYFPPINSPNQKDDSESPYKGYLSEIKASELNTSENDADAFKSPLVFGKPAKMLQLKPPPPTTKNKSKKKTSKKSPSLQKTINWCFMGKGDTNPEHLQMALALSESSYLSENPSEVLDSVQQQSPQGKLQTLKKTLEQFGFKCNQKSKIDPVFKKQPVDNNCLKKSKRSRYQFVTPILFMRTQVERDELISRKVSIILNGSDVNRQVSVTQALKIQICDDLLASEVLETLSTREPRFLRYNSMSLSELNQCSDVFYVECLKLDQNVSKCGQLLKSWSSIAGREISPTREIILAPMTENEDKSPNYNRSLTEDLILAPMTENEDKSPVCNRSLTPDLFDDSEVLNSHHQASVIERKVDEFLRNMEDFDETANNDSVAPVVYCDLTLSSDEEITKTPKFLEKEGDEEIKAFGRNLPREELEESFIQSPEDIITSKKSGEMCFDLTNSLSEEELGESENSFQILAKPGTTSSTNNLDDSEYTIILNNSLQFFENNPEAQKSLSQESSGSILISDDELNYSNTYSTTSLNKRKSDDNFGCKPISDNCLTHDLENINVLNKSDDVKTPKRKKKEDVIFKSENITPMLNYDRMSSPDLKNELDKFGIKALKRKKGVKLLKYIYEATHPIVGPSKSNSDDDDGPRLVKKRKLEHYFDNKNEIVGDIVQDDELLNDELIFERTQSKRISSCRIPLQIVWHNFLSNNPEIKENVLIYAPLQLEVLHAMLKQHGYKFHIQDLLTFLDRKCITIRTSQANKKS